MSQHTWRKSNLWNLYDRFEFHKVLKWHASLLSKPTRSDRQISIPAAARIPDMLSLVVDLSLTDENIRNWFTFLVEKKTLTGRKRHFYFAKDQKIPLGGSSVQKEINKIRWSQVERHAHYCTFILALQWFAGCGDDKNPCISEANTPCPC